MNGPLSGELTRFIAGERIRVVTCGAAALSTSQRHCAARQATGKHLLLLNDDTEVIAGEWMRAMLEFSQQPEISAVGAKLLFPDGRLRHSDAHRRRRPPCGAGDIPVRRRATSAAIPWIIRNYSAVTGACS